MANPLMGGPPPDLSAVGNAASAPKAPGGGQQLQEFTVKRRDDGGVTVCETSAQALPPGRRYGASFTPQRGTYLETPFPDGQGVAEKLIGLLGQLGVSATPEAESPAEDQGEGGMEEGAAGGPPPPPPAAMAARRGPGGGGAMVARRPPMPPGGGY